MKGGRSEPEGAGEADLTSEQVMGHKNASGPMDGVGKPMGPASVDIESLSGLRQVLWCTDRHMLPYWFQKRSWWNHSLIIKGPPRNGGGTADRGGGATES